MAESMTLRALIVALVALAVGGAVGARLAGSTRIGQEAGLASSHVHSVGTWIDNRQGAARMYLADDDLGHLVVLATSREATAREREGLAAALRAEWRPDGDRWRLTPRQEAKDHSVAVREAGLARALSELPRPGTPYSDANAVLRALERFAEARARQGARAPVEPPVRPASSMLIEFARSLGPSALARLKWEDPAVWAPRPRPGERNLPEGTAASLAHYEGVVTALSELAAPGPSGVIAQYASREYADLTAPFREMWEVGDVVVIARRLENDVFLMLRVFDREGGTRDGASLRLPLTIPDPLTLEAIAKVDARVPLDDTAQLVYSLFPVGREADALPVRADHGPSRTPADRVPLEWDPDFDPLAAMLPGVLPAIETALGGPTVMILPDRALTSALMAARSKEFDVGAFLRHLAEETAFRLDRHADTYWFVPPDLETLAYTTTDREALRLFAARCKADRRVSLEAWARLHREARSAPARSPVVIAWVRALTQAGTPWEAGHMGYAAWRLIGELNPDARELTDMAWNVPHLPEGAHRTLFALARSQVAEGREPAVTLSAARWLSVGSAAVLRIEVLEEPIAVAAHDRAGGASLPRMALPADAYARQRLDANADRLADQPDPFSGLVWSGRRKVVRFTVTQGDQRRIHYDAEGAGVWDPSPVPDSDLPAPFRAPPQP